MLNFVLCDDNLPTLNRLAKMLEAIFINNNIDATVALKSQSSKAILDYIENNKVDVLLLDINLKEKVSGCDIADIVRKKNKDVYIIFTTGHLEYALLAYKYKTFDYLPKPVIEEKLEETILRLIDDMEKSPARFLKLNNNKTIINQNDINYIRRDGMKLIVHTADRTYESYTSFNKIENCLPENFVRCHKSFIANVNNITNIESNKNIISFSNNENCFIGAKYKNNFMEVFKNGNLSNNLDSINNRK